jgi:serine/threonine protein kinase
MPLSPGTRVGSYEIVAPLGSGGMGEVYRARDKQLDRDVAVKILQSTIGSDPSHLSRFEREAKTLAALNHPNIAQIYGLERGPAGGAQHDYALVMELIDGPSPSACSGVPSRSTSACKSHGRLPKRWRPRTRPALSIAM